MIIYRSLLKKLLSKKIKLNLIIDPLRPTTNKNTISTGIYKILQIRHS